MKRVRNRYGYSMRDMHPNPPIEAAGYVKGEKVKVYRS